MVYYLTAEEIIFLHYTMMEMHDDIKQAGVKFPEKFEWMLERPKTKVFGEEQFPTVIEKACCYYHSIARGHIFHNGNKRTALVVFVTFLDLHGYEFTMTNKEAEDFTVYLAEDDKFRGNDCIRHLVNELKDYIRPL
ncbi:Death-on-curing family protein [[Clostridium] ultunense Esp]|uniref:type II toxin-antitoxin system death-on-curing family toxin n=1 Tax=Thermicanus aegyptius TaxID=94009 RepID=UPI0002B6F1E1|nr:type II toxin-antitoxin system death-on-curing family toxin [Thermicanus aegyptius]CCQ96637.1 Death-on-curing family protein [[Clostridium] ultunense Esp]